MPRCCFGSQPHELLVLGHPTVGEGMERVMCTLRIGPLVSYRLPVLTLSIFDLYGRGIGAHLHASGCPTLSHISLRELVSPVILICMFAWRRPGIACCEAIMFGLGWIWLELTLRVFYHLTMSEARERVIHTLRYRIGPVVALLLPALTLPRFGQYVVRWAPHASIRVADSLLSLPLRELETPVSWPKCLLDEGRVLHTVKLLCLCSDGWDLNVHWGVSNTLYSSLAESYGRLS